MFGFLASAITNPENKTRVISPVDNKFYFSKDIADRVPRMYNTIMAVQVGLTVIAIFTVRRNPNFVKSKKVNNVLPIEL